MNRNDLRRLMRGPAQSAQDPASLAAELEQARSEIATLRQELFEAKQREKDDAEIIARLQERIAAPAKAGAQ